MNLLFSCLTAVTLFATSAAADPWKDESGNGERRGYYGDPPAHYYAREYKDEFRSGGCKVERKWERNGGYREEVKCDGRRGR
jgi:hypothetical protein